MSSATPFNADHFAFRHGESQANAVISPPSAAEISRAALTSESYSAAIRATLDAQQADPMNPLHAWREILAKLRYGRFQEVSVAAERFADALPENPLPTYVRGLALLRMGDAKRAGNVINQVLSAAPQFIPAQFLYAESQSYVKIKGMAKQLSQLPKKAEFATLWLDLLAKLIVVHGKTGLPVVEGCLKKPPVLPENSRELAILQSVMELYSSTLEQIEEKIGRTAEGSRFEEIVLLFYHDRLKELPNPHEALRRLRRLCELFPQRSALTRLYAARMTRAAARLSSEGRFLDALALVERCLTLEPYETIHFQNRAALFTLMKELAAYHMGWFELNRHVYRLALLGMLGPKDARGLVKLHRLFSQQARLSSRNPGIGQRDDGIFMLEKRQDGGSGRTIFKTNQVVISRDPDQLRQWIYHRQAELFFRHWVLSASPYRMLLQPDSSKIARTRLAVIDKLSLALQKLIPEEGELLREAMWRRMNLGGRRDLPRYAEAPEDADVELLRREYLETIADLAVLCQTWEPDARRKDLLEEIVSFIEMTVPFLNRATLKAVLKDAEDDTSFEYQVLSSEIDDAIGESDTHEPIDFDQSQRISHSLIADLLINMSYAVFEANRETHDAASRALAYIDRVRALELKKPRHECIAAKFLYVGEFYDEARQAIARFYRFNGQLDHQLNTDAGNILQKLDDERKKKNKGKRRSEEVFTDDTPAEPYGNEEEQLLCELDEYPTSVSTYVRLVNLLASRGACDEAIEWSERAQVKCLGRQVIYRARQLNLLALAFKDLHERDPNAVNLYLKGSHHAPIEAILKSSESEPSYPLWYLLGLCQLAIQKRDDALRSFEKSLSRCQRPIHRSVLKRMTTDIDTFSLDFARPEIANAIATNNYGAALEILGACMAGLAQAQLGLLDLAEIYVQRGINRIGSDSTTSPDAAILIRAPWANRLQQAMTLPNDLDRAAALAELSRELNPASEAAVKAVLEKVRIYNEQAQVATTLAKSAKLLKEGHPQHALQELDSLKDAGNIPHVQRQKALLLLTLERFDEADAMADALSGGQSEVGRQFGQKYPSLRQKQRLRAANRLLRDGQALEALKLIDNLPASTPDDATELAYTQAFAHSMQGYQAKRDGNIGSARQSLRCAMQIIERTLAQPSAVAGKERFIKLYEKLDQDLERLEG